jgi:hypothetical protein
MSTSTSSRTGFLSLPPELRLKIYNLIADKVPYEEPLSDYDGLRLYCSLVKSECDHEFTKRFSEFVAVSSMGNLDPVTIDSLQHLTIRMSSGGWFESCRRILSSPPLPLEPKWYWISTLRLRKLNIHLEVGQFSLGQAFFFWHKFIARGERAKEMAPCVVLDIVYSDKPPDKEWEGYKDVLYGVLCYHYSDVRAILLESRKTVRVIYKKWD